MVLAADPSGAVSGTSPVSSPISLSQEGAHEIAQGGDGVDPVSFIRSDVQKLRPGSNCWSTVKDFLHRRHLGFLFSAIFFKSFGIASVVGLTAAGIQLSIDAGIFHPLVVGEDSGSLFGQLTFLVGLVLSFRTSQAYSRFWSGCLEVYKVQADWYEACSSLVSFVKRTPEPCSKVEDFRQLIVRLFSLMFAHGMADICEHFDDQAQHLELLDPDALHPQFLHDLKGSQNRRDLVLSWIHNTIMENIESGVLTCPAPILSRVFHELSNGAVALHHAAVVSKIPFPNAYTQACNGLVSVTTLGSAILMHAYVSNAVTAFVFSFAQAFFLWTLNFTACELANPFGSDDNDVDLGLMQSHFNQRLQGLLEPKSHRSPRLVFSSAPDHAIQPLDHGVVLDALWKHRPRRLNSPMVVVRSAEVAAEGAATRPRMEPGGAPEAPDSVQPEHSVQLEAKATPEEPTEQPGHAPAVMCPEPDFTFCFPQATSSAEKPAQRSLFSQLQPRAPGHEFAAADAGPGLPREDSEDTPPNTAISISAALPAKSSPMRQHGEARRNIGRDAPRASQQCGDALVASVAL